jgi:hypothetical protein
MRFFCAGMTGKPRRPTIRQIEFELEQAERGMSMPYDAERHGVAQHSTEARKQKRPRG